MSDWITLTTVGGGTACVRRDAITSYRDAEYHASREWVGRAQGETARCRLVCTSDDNICVTETMDELRALIGGEQ